MSLAKFTLVCGLAVFVLSFAPGAADAVYYVKKKKTESAPAVKNPPQAVPQAAQQQPPSPDQAYAFLASRYGPCTEDDIKNLQGLRALSKHDEELAADEKRSGDKPSPSDFNNVAAFYASPGNVEKIAVMNLRCGGVNLDAPPKKTGKTKKK